MAATEQGWVSADQQAVAEEDGRGCVWSSAGEHVAKLIPELRHALLPERIPTRPTRFRCLQRRGKRSDVGRRVGLAEKKPTPGHLSSAPSKFSTHFKLALCASVKQAKSAGTTTDNQQKRPEVHRPHEDRGETANASLASDVLAGLAVFLMRELQARRAGSIGRTSTSHFEDEFVPYTRADVDNPEEQIHEFMDRSVQYRVQLTQLSQLTPQRFSHLSVRYTFFRETSTQTPWFRVDLDGILLGLEFRHIVDVSDALVKYVTSSNLSIELGHETFRDRRNASRVASPCRYFAAMATRDVDALWQELAMENEYRNVEVSRLLKKSMATGGNAKKAKASDSGRAACVSTTYPTSGASARDDCKTSKNEEVFSLPKVLNRLAAEQRSVRKKAALALETQFLNDATAHLAASGAFAEMAKPLFKRFNDPVEKVREVCIRLTTKCIAEEEDLLRYLPYLMPAITNRINSQYGYDEENQVFSRDQFLHDAFKRGRVYVAENQVTRLKPDEPSEEIRLLLLGLVDAVLQNAFEHRASSILHAYIFDVLLVLISGIHDDFHEVNIASCRILAAISNTWSRPYRTSRRECHPRSDLLHAEVRLNYFAKLDQDRNPIILGERYEREHGEEVIEMKQYGVDGKNPTFNYRAPLPEPFVAGRPSLGTQLFVRGRARRFLNPILRELANWQDSTRAHAVRLLKCVLVYCEETITVDVHLLVNTLLRTWGGDHDLLPQLRQCADLAGRFAAPITYLPLLLSRIRGDSDVVVPLAATVGGGVSAASQAAVALQVLHCLLQGSLDKMVLSHVPEILDTITLPSILDLESSAVKLALGQVLLHITMLLERMILSRLLQAFFLERGRLTLMEQSYSRIFDIGIVVMASSYCSAAVADSRIARGIDQLYDKHGSSLLQRTLQGLQDMLSVQWSPHCAAQLAFEQILTSAPVALLLEHGADLNNLFQTILQTEPPSPARSRPKISSPNATTAAKENAKKSRRAREQNFARVLKGMVERVQAELEKQGDSSESSVEASYVKHWADLLSATKAAAA
ncbi:Armadillo-type fold [Phytophthora cactorum]|nr:Armadillo-type fold [Phytophthora cactorum]